MISSLTRLALCAAVTAPILVAVPVMAAPAMAAPLSSTEMPQSLADRARERSAERARRLRQIENARLDAEFEREEQEAARAAAEQARVAQTTQTSTTTTPNTETPAQASATVTPQ